MIEPDFEKANMALVTLSRDVDALEKKFGEGTKWVIEKRNTLNVILSFYDNMVDYADSNDQLIKMLSINNKSLNLILYKKEMDMPWMKVMKSKGVKPLKSVEFLKQIDKDLLELAKTDD